MGGASIARRRAPRPSPQREPARRCVGRLLCRESKRERLMGRLNPIQRRLDRFMQEPPSVRNAAGVIVVATIVVVVRVSGIRP